MISGTTISSCLLSKFLSLDLFPCLIFANTDCSISIDLYFEHMTAFSLFQQPSFRTKLRRITSSLQLAAVLASMFSYSARLEDLRYNCNSQDASAASAESAQTPEVFANQAQRFVDD